MARIAVIDDAIHDRLLPQPVAERYCLRDGVFDRAGPCGETGLSHGTLVASVLAQYAQAYELISVQIVGNWFETRRCPSGRLCQALDFCAEIGCDVVNVSLGSKRLSGGRGMAPAIRRLARAGIPVIAACSNTFHRTVPAAQPGVLGVVCDPAQHLVPGAYACAQNPYLGTEYIANYELTLPGLMDAHRSNSLAAAVLTARVNNLLGCSGASRDGLAAALCDGAAVYGPSAVSALAGADCGSVPVVYLAGVLHDQPEEQIALLDLFCDSGYEVLGVSDRRLSQDARFLDRAAVGHGPAREMQQRLCACAKVDLILVFAPFDWFSTLDWDGFDADAAAIVSTADASNAIPMGFARQQYAVSRRSDAQFLYHYLLRVL